MMNRHDDDKDPENHRETLIENQMIKGYRGIGVYVLEQFVSIYIEKMCIVILKMIICILLASPSSSQNLSPFLFG